MNLHCCQTVSNHLIDTIKFYRISLFTQESTKASHLDTRLLHHCSSQYTTLRPVCLSLRGHGHLWAPTRAPMLRPFQRRPRWRYCRHCSRARPPLAALTSCCLTRYVCLQIVVPPLSRSIRLILFICRYKLKCESRVNLLLILHVSSFYTCAELLQQAWALKFRNSKRRTHGTGNEK
jgi:hypothetical protein